MLTGAGLKKVGTIMKSWTKDLNSRLTDIVRTGNRRYGNQRGSHCKVPSQKDCKASSLGLLYWTDTDIETKKSFTRHRCHNSKSDTKRFHTSTLHGGKEVLSIEFLSKISKLTKKKKKLGKDTVYMSSSLHNWRKKIK